MPLGTNYSVTISQNVSCLNAGRVTPPIPHSTTIRLELTETVVAHMALSFAR